MGRDLFALSRNVGMPVFDSDIVVIATMLLLDAILNIINGPMNNKNNNNKD